jgi:hypothetical protein
MWRLFDQGVSLHARCNVYIRLWEVQFLTQRLDRSRGLPYIPYLTLKLIVPLQSASRHVIIFYIIALLILVVLLVFAFICIACNCATLRSCADACHVISKCLEAWWRSWRGLITRRPASLLVSLHKARNSIRRVILSLSKKTGFLVFQYNTVIILHWQDGNKCECIIL